MSLDLNMFARFYKASSGLREDNSSRANMICDRFNKERHAYKFGQR